MSGKRGEDNEERRNGGGLKGRVKMRQLGTFVRIPERLRNQDPHAPAYKKVSS